MAKAIFFSQPTMGHTNAMLTIACKLKEEGHEVLFGVPSIGDLFKKHNDKLPEIIKTSMNIPKKIQANSIQYLKFKAPTKVVLKSALLPLTSGFIETQYAINVFTDGLYEYATTIEEIVLREKPDVLVTDFTFIPPYLVGEKNNIPCILIYHSGLPFGGAGVPPLGTGLPIEEQWGRKGEIYSRIMEITNRILNRRVVKVSYKMGLTNPPIIDLKTPYSRWANILLTAKEIEAPRMINSDCTFFVGPCFALSRNDVNTKFEYDWLNTNVKKIYVSLGTVFNNKPNVFKKILEGISKSNYQIIVSAGGAYNELIKEDFRENVMIYKSVPQLEVLRCVDLVISHGGNNTINETLMAGKPILVMPVGGEQADNASKIEYLQVGKRVDISNFTGDEIVEKVDSLLSESQYDINVKKVSEILNNTDGVGTSAKLIAWVADNKSPAVLIDKIPCTIFKDTNFGNVVLNYSI